MNLNNDSTIQEIKDKFRELVLRYHPDKCKNVKDVEEKLSPLIQKAYKSNTNNNQTEMPAEMPAEMPDVVDVD